MEAAAVAASGRELVSRELFAVAGTPVSLTTLAMLALILIASWVLSRLLRGAVVRAMQARNVGDPGTHVLVRRVLHYAVMAVGIAVALDTVGVSLSAVFAAGAVFAVGIGFAMQNIVQNFMSGVILLVERTIHPGDVILLQGQVVRVVEMGIRTTVVISPDGIETIVPNTTLAQNSIEKLTGHSDLIRLHCVVGVAYGSDMRQVKQVLLAAATSFPGRVAEPEPAVQLKDFAASAVEWDVMVWVDDPWRSSPLTSDLREAVWFALKDAGIEVAFPQVDVHFDPPVLDLLRPQRSA